MPDRPVSIADFSFYRDREQRRFHARRPKRIGDVVAQVVSKRGYGRFQSIEDLAEAWRSATGDGLARFSRPGRLRRGMLEITASNSTVVQELTFQKQAILTSLKQQLPDARIRDLRIRVGTID